MAIEQIIIDDIQLRRNDAATWTTNNPTLLDGELGFERDTYKVKIGNGVDDWNTLSYTISDAVIGQLSDLSDVTSASPANRFALLGTGTTFISRALVLQDITDYDPNNIISDFDTALAQTRWKAIEVPTGGTTNQVLAKSSGTNYDVGWQTPSSNQHIIQEEGSNLTARTNLNFIGANVTATDNSGNDATDITISGSGVLNLKDFGTVGDGVADDTTAINAAHTALPAEGGTIIVPTGIYLHDSAITFTKKVTLIGEGTGNTAAASSSVFLKGTGLSSDGFILSGFGSIVEKIAFAGEAGNTGDGLVIKAGRISLKDVAAFDMGTDGIRIGTDAGAENCNLWYIENLKSKSNGGSGLTISEGTGGGADANGGTLVHADLQSNGSHGLEIGNAQLNTFVGVVSQSNTGDGIHCSTDSNYNTFTGGDFEGQTNEINIVSGAVENKFYGGVIGGGLIVDNGTRTILNGISDGTSADSQFNNVNITGTLDAIGYGITGIGHFSNELLTDSDFSANNGTAWTKSGEDGTHILTWSGGTVRYESDTTTPQLSFYQPILTIGKYYEITVETTVATSGSLKTDAFGTSDVISNGVGTITVKGIAENINATITRNSTNVDITLTSFSVKEIIPLEDNASGDFTVTGTVALDGATSGTATITAPAVAGTPTLTLPTTTGTFELTGHTHSLTDVTDVTATVTEINNATDLSGLTAGWVYSADTATTASWKAQVGGGSSLPVVDTTSIVEGSVDNTKELKFEVDGNTTAIIGTIATAFTTAKTITIPDATDTLVGKATTDTFTNKTFDANGTGNSLSNVDVADLANGIDGELITWDASGVPDTVAVGTATHVLTSNGVGVAPTFQAAPGGAASTGTGTAFSITNTSGYYYNMASANSGTTYTTTGTTTGAWAQGLINAASEPVVTGATKEGGAEFIASTDMYIVIYHNGTAMKFYFVAIAVGASAHPAELIVSVSNENSELSTGTAKATFRMPYAMTLTDVRASVTAGPSGADLVIDINESGTTVLSTKLEIDGGTRPTETLTLSANAANTNTVTIDTKTYTFQDTLTDTDGNVHIGASASDTIDNLIAAITLGAGKGVDYATATTLHTTCTATVGTGDTMEAYARIASTATYATTDNNANMSWGAANMSGGVEPERTSETAVTSAVISDSSLADDAEITIDIDTIGSDPENAGKGLKVTLIGTRT